MSSTVFCCDAEEPLCGEQEGLLSSLGVQHVAGQKQLSDSGSPKTPASPRRPDTSSLSTSSGLGNIASEGSTIHLVPIGSPSVASMVMSDHSFSGSPGTSWVGVYASSPSRSQNPIGSPVLSNAVAILPESTGANHEQFAEITANDVNLCRDTSLYAEATESSTKGGDSSGRGASPLAMTHVLSSFRNFAYRGTNVTTVPPAGVPVSRHFDRTRSTPFEISKFDRRDPYQIFYLPVDCPYGRRCSDGDCPLAHTKLEKIFHPIVYKTQKCQMAVEGRCEYLQKCAFFHTEEDKQEAEGQWKRWELWWSPWRQLVDDVLVNHKKLDKEIRRKVDGIMKIRMPRLAAPVCGMRGASFLVASEDSKARHVATNWNSPVNSPLVHEQQCVTSWCNNAHRGYQGVSGGRTANRSRLTTGANPFRGLSDVTAPKPQDSLNCRPIMVFSGDSSADNNAKRLKDIEHPKSAELQQPGMESLLGLPWGDAVHGSSGGTVDHATGEVMQCQGAPSDTKTVFHRRQDVIDPSKRDQAAHCLTVKLEGTEMRRGLDEWEEEESSGCGGFNGRFSEAVGEFHGRGTVVSPECIWDRMHWMCARSNSNEVSRRQVISPRKSSGGEICGDLRSSRALGFQRGAEDWNENGGNTQHCGVLSDLAERVTLHSTKWQEGSVNQHRPNQSTDSHPLESPLCEEAAAAGPLSIKRLDECTSDMGIYGENRAGWHCTSKRQATDECFEDPGPGYSGHVVVCNSNSGPKCPGKVSNTRIEQNAVNVEHHLIERQVATIPSSDEANHYMEETSICWSEDAAAVLASEVKQGTWEGGLPFSVDIADMRRMNMHRLVGLPVDFSCNAGAVHNTSAGLSFVECPCPSSSVAMVRRNSRGANGQEPGMCRSPCKNMDGVFFQDVVCGRVGDPNLENRLRIVYESTGAAAVETSGNRVFLLSDGMVPSNTRELLLLPNAGSSPPMSRVEGPSTGAQGEFDVVRESMRASGVVPAYTDASLTDRAGRIPCGADASEPDIRGVTLALD